MWNDPNARKWVYKQFGYAVLAASFVAVFVTTIIWFAGSVLPWLEQFELRYWSVNGYWGISADEVALAWILMVCVFTIFRFCMFSWKDVYPEGKPDTETNEEEEILDE